MKKVWLVTGTSHGLGNALVKELLTQGYPVAATSRNAETLSKEFGEHENFLPLSMNLEDESDVKKAIKKLEEKFGRIDVLVNNAGYTHLATIEEMTDSEVRAIAVKALSETLAMEVREFGIHVTDVKPGFMRTEFFGKSYKTTSPENSPYKNLYDDNMKFYNGQNGNQAGDPSKAAKLYIKVAEMENPYESLPMGTDSVEGIRAICEDTIKLMDEVKPVAITTDF